MVTYIKRRIRAFIHFKILLLHTDYQNNWSKNNHKRQYGSIFGVLIFPLQSDGIV